MPSPGVSRLIPPWVRVVDVALFVLAAMTVTVLAGWHPRLRLWGTLSISIRSWVRPLAWFVLLFVVRHALWRSIPWHCRAAGWVRTAAACESLRASLPAFLLSRLIMLSVGYGAVATFGIPMRAWRAMANDFFDLFARWDSGWYITIASSGYGGSFTPSEQHPIAFFPGLPLLMRIFARLFDVDLWSAGILVVCGTFLWGLTYVYRLAREDMGPDQAKAAVLLLSFYPFAVCFSAVLTEAPFLLCAAAAFYHFRREEVTRAAAFGFVAGLLRPNGFLLSGPLGLLAVISFVRARGWVRGSGRVGDSGWRRLLLRLAIAAVPAVGMLTFSAYAYSAYGDPFAWAKAQQAWGRGPTAIVNVVVDHTLTIQTQGLADYIRGHFVDLFEAAAAIFALVLIGPISRRFGVAYGLFVALSVVPPFITMGSVSLGRYTAPLFPLFLWLGASIPARHQPYWVGGFAAGQSLVAALFYTWRAPY